MAHVHRQKPPTDGGVGVTNRFPARSRALRVARNPMSATTLRPRKPTRPLGTPAGHGHHRSQPSRPGSLAAEDHARTPALPRPAILADEPPSTPQHSRNGAAFGLEWLDCVAATAVHIACVLLSGRLLERLAAVSVKVRRSVHPKIRGSPRTVGSESPEARREDVAP